MKVAGIAQVEMLWGGGQAVQSGASFLEEQEVHRNFAVGFQRRRCQPKASKLLACKLGTGEGHHAAYVPHWLDVLDNPSSSKESHRITFLFYVMLICRFF